MDLEGLITELQIRGFDQQRIDSALRCLVHVYAVQDHTNSDAGGVLVKDILSSYPLEVTQAASELYFERLTVLGHDVYRLKWGYEATARRLEKQLWENASSRWDEFVATLDDRFLGFFLPLSYEEARVVDYWKSRKDLKWFGVQVEGIGWDVLRLIEDVMAVGYAVDLAFGYRPFDAANIESQRTLLHKKAFESLKEKAKVAPEAYRRGIKLWKFFTEFEPAESDVVKLLGECGLSPEEVEVQVGAFHDAGLTTAYRATQYPPFLVVDKRKKDFEVAVRELLSPMEAWLLRGSDLPLSANPVPVQEESIIQP